MSQVNSKLKAMGRLTLTLRDADGNVKQHLDLKNLVVNTGLNYLALAVRTAITDPMVAIAVGTGATAPAPGDTTLQTEINRGAFTADSTTANVTTLTRLIAAGDGTGALTEAGIFNDDTAGGVMLSRVTFPVVNKQVTDTLEITWTISFLNA